MPYLNLAKGFRRIKERSLMTDLSAIRLTLAMQPSVLPAPHMIYGTAAFKCNT